jgi:lysophospholipase L1-like esterase
MKKTLLLPLLFVISFAEAQSPYFPMAPQGYGVEFLQRLVTEGYPQSYYSPTFGLRWKGTVGGLQQSGGLPAQPPATKAYWCQSIVITSNYSCVLQTLFGYYASLYGAYPQSATNVVVGPSGVTLNTNMLIRAKMKMPSFTLLDFPDASASSTVAYSPNNSIVMTKTSQVAIAPDSLQRCSTVVKCTNASVSSVVNFVVKDPMPRFFRYVSATGTNFTFSYDSTQRMLTATYTGTLTASGTANYSVTGQVMQTLDIAINSFGYQIDSDVNYNGKPLAVCGTSISDGTGITEIEDSYLIQVRNYLKDRDTSVNLRLVNKSIGGTTSSHHEILRKNEGRYDFIEAPKLFIYEQGGINDFSQGVPLDTTLKNIVKMIRHVQSQAPNCQFFLLAPWPTANTTTEAGLVIRRAAFATLMASGLPPDIDASKAHYIAGTGNMFDPVTQSGTYTDDGVHLNEAGNRLGSNKIIDYIIATPLEFK